MPYTIRKQKCKQSDGDSGSYTLSYTDKKGKNHRACHTSRKKAQGQIAAIEMEGTEELKSTIREIIEELTAPEALEPLGLLLPPDASSPPAMHESYFKKIASKLRGTPTNLPAETDEFLESFMIDLQNYVKEFQHHQQSMPSPVKKVALMGAASEITKLNNSLRPIINALRTGDDASIRAAAAASHA
jgi:hypothetical protein